MTGELAGKGAVVAGGSTGIGRATAFALARAGADVAICARHRDDLEETAKEIAIATGRLVVPIVADMGKYDDIQRFVSEAATRLGRIDILVNSAGDVARGHVTELPDEAFVDAIQVKLLGSIRCARAVLPYMRQRGGGCIIMIAGSAGRETGAGTATRGIVNAGIINFTKSLGDGVAKDNIRVIAISPGPINTRQTLNRAEAMAQEQGVSREQILQRFIAGIPLGRLGEPEDIADTILFLVSERARFITATTIVVDGGSGRIAF